MSRLLPGGVAPLSYPKLDVARYCSKEGIDWAGVLNYVRDRCDFVDDRQLSKHLDVPSSTLSAVRKGNAEISMLAKFRMLDRFGYHLITEAVELLNADEIAAKQRRAARRHRASSARKTVA